jgi:hypothetical protein
MALWASFAVHGTFLVTLPFLLTCVALAVERFGLKRSRSMQALLVALIALVAWILYTSRHQMRTPTWGDLTNIAVAACVLAVFDALLRLVFRFDARVAWCALHSFANALVVLFAFNDTIFVLVNPYRANDLGDGVVDQSFAHSVMLALHLYHTLAYSVDAMDLIHHLVSAFLIGFVALLFHFGGLVGAVDFFMSGLPGGIDYALLALVAAGRIDSLTEKRVNRWLNLACRMPGLFFVLNAGLLTKLHDVDSNFDVPYRVLFLIAACHGANALYFANRVVANSAIRLSQSNIKQSLEDNDNVVPIAQKKSE